MQNGLHEYAVDHTGFYVISKLFTQTLLIGRGDVTFLHVTYTKPSQNVEKLTCAHERFKSPFFLWLTQILKAVTMTMVTAITFFGHLCATQPYSKHSNSYRKRNTRAIYGGSRRAL